MITYKQKTIIILIFSLIVGFAIFYISSGIQEVEKLPAYRDCLSSLPWNGSVGICEVYKP